MSRSVPSTLEAIHDWSLSQLVRAGADPRSPFRWPVMCTSAAAGAPSGRVVVLRRFDPTSRDATIYTDQRSHKMRDLHANSRAELVFFDPKRMVQIRLAGSVSLIDTGPVWTEAFERIGEHSLGDYAAVPAPGEQISAAEPDLDPALAKANFSVIRVRANTLDYLSLGRDGHKRARLVWSDGCFQSTWVAP